MKSAFAVLLSCATVVVIGAGIGGRQPTVANTLPMAVVATAAIDLAVPTAAATVPNVAPAAGLVFEHAAPRTVALRVLPTVYVTASRADLELDDAGPSVMLDAAVDGAAAAMVGGAARSAQRIGLAVPYFAFAQVSAGGAE